MPETDNDLVIVGGGAAGLTAAVFACRARLSTLLLESMMAGGQVVNAERIENYPGFPDGIAGAGACKGGTDGKRWVLQAHLP